jgi:hypothetical protein
MYLDHSQILQNPPVADTPVEWLGYLTSLRRFYTTARNVVNEMEEGTMGEGGGTSLFSDSIFEGGPAEQAKLEASTKHILMEPSIGGTFYIVPDDARRPPVVYNPNTSSWPGPGSHPPDDAPSARRSRPPGANRKPRASGSYDGGDMDMDDGPYDDDYEQVRPVLIFFREAAAIDMPIYEQSEAN